MSHSTRAERFRRNPPVAAALLLLAALSTAAVADTPADQAAPAWRTDLTLTLQETYDTNVYLQDTAPAATVAGAMPAKAGSLVTLASVTAEVERRFSDALTAGIRYAPELVRFHSAAGENHAVHRASLNCSGRFGDNSWSFQNSVVAVDGPELAPIYGGPGGAPALGGAPVRDRRRAVVDRGSFKLVHTRGAWMARPVATVYLHDFRTLQERVTGYSNFIDRSELLGGLDLGCTVARGTRAIAGFRYGTQQQFQLHGADSPFDSTIRRFVVGLEGSPWSWLKLAVLAGPESRGFAAGTPAGFDHNEQPLWIDGSATLVLSPRQNVAFSYRRQQLPSSSSVAVYDAIDCDIAWRCRWNGRLSSTAGCKLARGDWRAPALREDRIASPSLSLQFVPAKRHTLDVGWTFDRGLSRVPATDGREFNRHAFSASYRFAL